jgi:SNF2 family DNA or RNA helicase
MKLIDNINELLGDDIKQSAQPGARLKIAASTFSIYAFEALKRELESVESFEFIFTSPSVLPDEVTDAAKKERREFHIPKSPSATQNERSFYGTEFEVQLKNKLTQRAIARECADWMRRKAKFRSNSGAAPMQQFAAVQAGVSATVPNAVYMPLHGFTAVDLGYQRGNAVSNIVGLGKTFTALAVIKYYELRNRSVLVLCHTDLQRTSGESFGTPLNRVNWGNYDLVVIDESHNFRNNDAYKDKGTRYQKLMNSVIKQGVKTKVLMARLESRLAQEKQFNRKVEINAQLRTIRQELDSLTN